MSDETTKPEELIGKSGLSQKELGDLCRYTGLSKGLFSHRLLVSRCLDNLITTGKLRVVVEVGLDDGGRCLGCGSWTDDDDPCNTTYFDYCPGCGNKIKR